MSVRPVWQAADFSRVTSKLPGDLQGSLENWLDGPHFSTGIQAKRVQTESSLDATLDNVTALAGKVQKLVSSSHWPSASGCIQNIQDWMEEIVDSFRYLAVYTNNKLDWPWLLVPGLEEEMDVGWREASPQPELPAGCTWTGILARRRRRLW